MADTYTKIADFDRPGSDGGHGVRRIPKKLRVAPFAKVDVPWRCPRRYHHGARYAYIGDADHCGEGEACDH